MAAIPRPSGVEGAGGEKMANDTSNEAEAKEAIRKMVLLRCITDSR